MEKKKKEIIIGIIGVVIVIILVVGATYAMYTFTGTGSKENIITAGKVSVSYEENNLINLTNQYATTDTVGINNTANESEMKFTVTSEITGDQIINYGIALDAIDEGETLTEEHIKVYLLKDEEVVYTFIKGEGRKVSEIRNYQLQDSKDRMVIDSYVMYTDTFTTNERHNYTLKAWVDENYKLPTTDTSEEGSHSNETKSETFKFKIKVVAIDDTMILTTRVPVIPDERCFEFNSETGAIEKYWKYGYPSEEVEGLHVSCPQNIIIPETINGVTVTTIGDRAFNGNNLPDSEAFIYARNDKNGDKIISEDEIDKTTLISYGGANKDVIIPSGVQTIDEEAFYFSELTSAKITGSVTTIGRNAFGVNSLKSVVISEGVETIGEYAFFDNRLTNVKIPGSVKTIGKEALGQIY